MFSRECKLHLEQAKMSRFQHFKHANQISWRLFMASFAAFIHAFAPRYFKTSATDTCIAIARENNKIQTKCLNVVTSHPISKTQHKPNSPPTVQYSSGCLTFLYLFLLWCTHSIPNVPVDEFLGFFNILILLKVTQDCCLSKAMTASQPHYFLVKHVRYLKAILLNP